MPASKVGVAGHPLLLSHSLTEGLRRLVGADIYVRVLRQDYAQPKSQEAELLGMSLQQIALIREVILHSDQEDFVYARTIVPESSLQGEFQRLKDFGNQPLGDFLFSYPKIRKEDMAFITETLADETQACGRRSVLWLGDKNLLIKELLLAPIWNYSARSDLDMINN